MTTFHKYKPSAFYGHACVCHTKKTSFACWLSKQTEGSRYLGSATAHTCDRQPVAISYVCVYITESVYRHEAAVTPVQRAE